MLRVDPQGRFYASFRSADMPMVFAPDGRYLRVLGRQGAGPGEFRMPMVVGVQGDTAWVVDPMNARITGMAVATDSVVVAGTLSNPALVLPLVSAVLLEGGSLLVNPQPRAADRPGSPLRLLRRDGSALAFGADAPPFDPRLPRLAMRVIAPARDGGAWVAPVTRYEVERYDQHGKLLERWRRNVPWFAAHQGEESMSDTRPPQPSVAAIAEDAQGRLWVFSRVADPRHRQAFRPRTPDQPAHIVNYERPDLYTDTIIEVFDIRRGVVIATTRIDEAWTPVPGRHGQSILLSKGVDAAYGGWQIEVRRADLIGAGR